MNYIKELRQELGLTQSVMAEMLGISRTNISLAELEIRELSTDNMIKLRKMKMRSMQEISSDLLGIEGFEETIAIRHADFRAKLEKLISACEKSLAKAEARLQSMTRKFNGSVEALKLIRKEQEIFAGVAAYEQRLADQFAVQKKVYTENHPSAQYDTLIYIEELKARLEVYRENLLEMENTVPGNQ